MLTNADSPADAAYAMAGVYLNPGARRSPGAAGGAVGPAVVKDGTDRDAKTPQAAETAPGQGTPDALERRVVRAERPQEALLDQGIEETFPASDPVSVERIT